LPKSSEVGVTLTLAEVPLSASVPTAVSELPQPPVNEIAAAPPSVLVAGANLTLSVTELPAVSVAGTAVAGSIV
jgi:hypothetical protein